MPHTTDPSLRLTGCWLSGRRRTPGSSAPFRTPVDVDLGAGIDHGARVVDGLDILDDDGAIQAIAEPGEVGDGGGPS